VKIARLVTTGAAPVILLAMLVASATWTARAYIVKNRKVQREAELRAITTVPVTQSEFLVTVDATGALEAINSTPVVSGVYGQIVTLAMNGIQVHKGDVVAELDVPRMVRQLEDTQSSSDDAQNELSAQKRDLAGATQTAQYELDQANQQLDQMKEQQEFNLGEQQKQLDYDAQDAAINAQRLALDRRLAQELLLPGETVDAEAAQQKAREFNVTRERKSLDLAGNQASTAVLNQQSEVNKASADLARAQDAEHSRIRYAQMQVDINEKQLTRVKDQISKSKIVAPANGVVILEQQSQARGTPSRDLEPGDPVSEGTKVATIADVSKMRVLLNLQPDQARLVKRKQAARVNVDAVPGKVFQGEIADISQTARAVNSGWMRSSDRTFQSHVALKLGKSTVLRPGMTAEAHIIIERIPRVLSLPIECIFTRQNGNFVYLKRGNQFVSVGVELGPQNGDHVVIKKGLDLGDRVALRDVGEQSTTSSERQSGSALPG
jgi:multidrug resistance efflux pump